MKKKKAKSKKKKIAKRKAAAKKVALKKKALKAAKAKLPKAKKVKVSAKEQQALNLIEKGKKRGFITYDDILKAFPTIESDLLFLDELYERLATAGVDVLEGGNLLDLDETEKTLKGYGKEGGSYDSIQMYLKEIGQYPLISAAMERELAKRIEKGDREAVDLLAKANLRLVVSIAKKYVGRSSDLS
ncbi:RNA polymerase sigma factor RpoD, partial [Candidatus Parcubacteria bacterium]|nr:RNA polymerase sigma factor RpoD [Candidatus Parcubacteria bacterium]